MSGSVKKSERDPLERLCSICVQCGLVQLVFGIFSTLARVTNKHLGLLPRVVATLHGVFVIVLGAGVWPLLTSWFLAFRRPWWTMTLATACVVWTGVSAIACLTDAALNIAVGQPLTLGFIEYVATNAEYVMFVVSKHVFGLPRITVLLYTGLVVVLIVTLLKAGCAAAEFAARVVTPVRLRSHFTAFTFLGVATAVQVLSAMELVFSESHAGGTETEEESLTITPIVRSSVYVDLFLGVLMQLAETGAWRLTVSPPRLRVVEAPSQSEEELQTLTFFHFESLRFDAVSPFTPSGLASNAVGAPADGPFSSKVFHGHATPFLTGLAERAGQDVLWLNQTFATVPYTLKVVFEVLCGLSPYVGMAGTWTEQHLSEAVPPLAQHSCLPRLLGMRGWRTIAVLNEEGMPKIAKSQHGFQEVIMDRNPERVIVKLREALAQSPMDRKTFVYFYFSLSHEGSYSEERWKEPYHRAFGMDSELQPFLEPIDGQRNVYLNLLHLGDRTAEAFAKVMSEGRADKGIRVWFSDHGVTFPGDEGVIVEANDVRHGASAARAEAHQVLAFEGIPPMLMPARPLPGLTRFGDVFATVGELVGFRAEGPLYVGNSLLSQPALVPHQFQGTHSFWDPDAFAVRTPRLAVVAEGGGLTEVFDRRKDPWEERPLDLRTMGPQESAEVYRLLHAGRAEKLRSAQIYGAIATWKQVRCNLWNNDHRWCNLQDDGLDESLTQVDQSEHCADWASKGECKKNPGYMEINCPVSCSAKRKENETDALIL